MESWEEVGQRAEALREEHQAVPFPKSAYAHEFVGDRSLVLLDANVAGCASAFVKNG